MGTPERVLSRRELNRALLARQRLLERARGPGVIEAQLHDLVGLQAQVPTDPYYALWSRIEDFDPHALGKLVESGEVVRATLMRGTIHMATADDVLRLRPAMDSVMRKTFGSTAWGQSLPADDLPAIVAAGRELLAAEPLTRKKLTPLIAERFPQHDPEALSYAVTYLVPLLQIPPRGVWGKTLQATFAPIEAFLGRELEREASVGDVVLRYLRAFGPASTKDIRTWSTKTGLREVVDELRPGLRVFTDEHGTELLDVPDGPLPDPETPAPVRFLPEFDNAFLAHADRSRLMTTGNAHLWWKGVVLVDGFIEATWRIDKKARRIEIEPYRALTKAERSEVEAEAVALAEFSEERLDVFLAG